MNFLNRGRGGRRNLAQRIQRQEKRLSRLQNRLTKIQADPSKARQVARLQKRIDRRSGHLERMKTRQQGVLTSAPIKVETPSGNTAPAVVVSSSDSTVVASAFPSGWDEAKYLAKNPDVAQAVKAGVIPSGHWHYTNHGKVEGRSLGDWSALTSNKMLWLGLVAAAGLWFWKRK